MIILLVLLGFGQSWSLQLEVDFDTLESWVYLGTFAFKGASDTVISAVRSSHNLTELKSRRARIHQYGLFNYSINLRKIEGSPVLLVYNDYYKWKRIFSSKSIDCAQKSLEADIIISITNQSSNSFQRNYVNYYDNIGSAEGVIVFNRAPAEWAFIAMSNCNLNLACKPSKDYCQGPISMSIQFDFTNGFASATKHFSYDQTGILWCTTALFVVQFVLVFHALLVRWRLLRLRKLHLTVKLLLFSVFNQWLALVLTLGYWYADYKSRIRNTCTNAKLYCIPLTKAFLCACCHRGRLGLSGHSSLPVKFLGIFLAAISDLSIILMCILVRANSSFALLFSFGLDSIMSSVELVFKDMLMLMLMLNAVVLCMHLFSLHIIYSSCPQHAMSSCELPPCFTLRYL